MQQPERVSLEQAGELDQWVTPQGFVDSYPQFTEAQINWVIRQRKTNGLEKVGAENIT